MLLVKNYQIQLPSLLKLYGDHVPAKHALSHLLFGSQVNVPLHEPETRADAPKYKTTDTFSRNFELFVAILVFNSKLILKDMRPIH